MDIIWFCAIVKSLMLIATGEQLKKKWVPNYLRKASMDGTLSRRIARKLTARMNRWNVLLMFHSKFLALLHSFYRRRRAFITGWWWSPQWSRWLIPLKKEKIRALHSLIIHHSQYLVPVDFSEWVDNRLAVVNHSSARFSTALNQSYACAASPGVKKKEQKLEQFPE